MYIESAHNPDLGGGWYLNPIINQDIPDPAVFREGTDYYLTGSTGNHFPALPIYHSQDLVNWNLLCHPFPTYRGNVWAPDLLKYGDRYYLYFTADGTNFVSWSNHIDRGWCDPIDLCVGCIDPGHCVMDGKRYLMLSGNMLQPLADDGLSIVGNMQCVCEPQRLPDDWDIEGDYPESPKVFLHGEYYYLIYADGGTGGPATAHAVMCARSKRLDGPWELSPHNPLIHTWNRDERWHAKGHGHLVDDPEGNWWIIYHAYEKGYMNQGRKLLLEPVAFTEDGWIVRSSSAPCDQPMKKPVGVMLPARDALSDDFQGPLGSQWMAHGRPDRDRIQCGSGRLCMSARPGNPGQSGPLTVIPGDPRYTAEASLSRPSDCEAGVILMYNDHYFSALGWDQGGKLTLYRLGRVQERRQVDAQRISIRLRNDRNYVAFYLSVDGGKYVKLNYVHNVESMNASAYGGFASLRAGLFAAGDGSATFGPFSYKADC